MKSINYILSCAVLMSIIFTINAQEASQINDKQNITEDKVEVYYFHNTRRCATCQAVEDVTKSALQEYYSELLESGVMTFKSLNIEEEANKSIAKELNVSGQSLLIIKEGKQEDLTNDAFMNARSNPDKLKEKIKEVIDSI